MLMYRNRYSKDYLTEAEVAMEIRAIAEDDFFEWLCERYRTNEVWIMGKEERTEVYLEYLKELYNALYELVPIGEEEHD